MSLLLNNTIRAEGTTKLTLYLPEEMIRALHAHELIFREDINDYIKRTIERIFKFNPSLIVYEDRNCIYSNSEIFPIDVVLPNAIAFEFSMRVERMREDISEIIYSELYFELYKLMPTAQAYEAEPSLPDPPDPPDSPDPPGYDEWLERNFIF